jgi:hypothetical protein
VQIYSRIARLQQFDSMRNEEAVFAWNRENAAMNRRNVLEMTMAETELQL